MWPRANDVQRRLAGHRCATTLSRGAISVALRLSPEWHAHSAIEGCWGALGSIDALALGPGLLLGLAEFGGRLWKCEDTSPLGYRQHIRHP